MKQYHSGFAVVYLYRENSNIWQSKGIIVESEMRDGEEWIHVIDDADSQFRWVRTRCAGAQDLKLDALPPRVLLQDASLRFHNLLGVAMCNFIALGAAVVSHLLPRGWWFAWIIGYGVALLFAAYGFIYLNRLRIAASLETLTR